MDIVDRLDAAGKPLPNTSMGNAKVTNPAAGTFPDGRRKITVSWLGVSCDAAYDASYTPTLNDIVTFLKAGSSFYVIGKPAH